MPIRCHGRGSYEHSSIFVGSGFETRLEDATNIMVDRCAHPTVDDSWRFDGAVLFCASVGGVNNAAVQGQYAIDGV